MDVEGSFLAHLIDAESMEKLVNVKAIMFADYNIRELLEFSQNYYLESGFQQAPTRELLDDTFPDTMAVVEWPETKYNISTLLDKLSNKYRKTAFNEIVIAAAEQAQDSPHNALSEALRGLTALQMDSDTSDRITLFSDALQQSLTNYLDAAGQEGFTTERGVFFMDELLDDFMFGLRRRELAVLLAATNIGKSWVLAKTALRAAEKGTKTYFASFEMGKDFILPRLFCLMADEMISKDLREEFGENYALDRRAYDKLPSITITKYQEGKLMPNELAAFRQVKDKFYDLAADNLVIDTPSRVAERTPTELYALARWHGAEFMVGDQLSWLTVDGRNDTEIMGNTIDAIASLTREHNMASLWAAQYNREATFSHNGRGTLQNAALSSKIERTVDWAFSLVRDKEHCEIDRAMLEHLKSRRTALSRPWRLDWNLKARTRLAVVGYDDVSLEERVLDGIGD